eukprot:2672277-Alexandrium_andersonii.AAC.1
MEPLAKDRLRHVRGCSWPHRGATAPSGPPDWCFRRERPHRGGLPHPDPGEASRAGGASRGGPGGGSTPGEDASSPLRGEGGLRQSLYSGAHWESLKLRFHHEAQPQLGVPSRVVITRILERPVEGWGCGGAVREVLRSSQLRTRACIYACIDTCVSKWRERERELSLIHI